MKKSRNFHIIQTFILSVFITVVLPSCQAMFNGSYGNLVITLPTLQSAGRAISKQGIEYVKNSTASYRVTVETESGNKLVQSGSQAEFRFSVPPDAKVKITVECLDAGGWTIAVVSMSRIITRGRNSIDSINFSRDGNEVLNSVGMRLVYLTGGKVPLTASYNPTVSGFRMSETEVTQKQWQDVVGNDGYGKKPTTEKGKGDNFPMYYVSWYDALVFCNKLSMKEGKTPCYSINGSTDPADWGTPPSSTGSDWDAAICNWSANGYRLPTEAEWEYAARGGSANPYTRYSGTAGATEDDLKTVAWYSGNSSSKAHEVNTMAGNANPIKDMSGNVWEWCWDWHNGNYDTSKSADPTGPSSSSSSARVKRGGSRVTNASSCGVYSRDCSSPKNRYEDFGFRVVCR